MHPGCADRQWMGQNTVLQHGPRCQTQALVTHAAHLTMAVVAIALLDKLIVRRKLSVGFGQMLRHDRMAVMRCRRLGLLGEGGRRQNIKVMRSAFQDWHPCTCP